MPHKRQTQPEWFSTADTAQALGCCTKHLHRLRNSGVLELGKHCRNISSPHAARPTYRWHLSRCSEVLDIPIEKR